MMSLKKYGHTPKATHQCYSFSSLGLLGSCVEAREVDDYHGIKYVFHNLFPLLALGTTE